MLHISKESGNAADDDPLIEIAREIRHGHGKLRSESLLAAEQKPRPTRDRLRYDFGQRLQNSLIN